MWVMNCYFADQDMKTFSMLPVSKGFVPSSSLHIDTASLFGLLDKKDERVKKYRSISELRISKEKEDRVEKGSKRRAPGRVIEPVLLDEKDVLWNAYFDIGRIISNGKKKKGIRFAHHITTDGVSVSVAVLYPDKTNP